MRLGAGDTVMANTYWVRDVVDGNTLAVEPSWVMDGRAGSLIRAAGLRVPPLDDPHGSLARTQMMLLLLGSSVQVTRVYGVQSDVLECDVATHGRDLRNHFPKYAVWENPETPKPPKPVSIPPNAPHP
jgi:hypothetical protein